MAGGWEPPHRVRRECLSTVHYVRTIIIDYRLDIRPLPRSIPYPRMTIAGLWDYVETHKLGRPLQPGELAGQTVVVDVSIW